MALGTLTLDGSPVGSSCLWPKWRKVAGVPIKAKTALWEDTAEFDWRSPNFYYPVTFVCHIIELTPWEKEIFLSDLRDQIGEGPIPGVWVRSSVQVDFTDLHWAVNPEGQTEAVRADLFTFDMWTNIKPVVGAAP